MAWLSDDVKAIETGSEKSGCQPASQPAIQQPTQTSLGDDDKEVGMAFPIIGEGYFFS